MGELRRRGRIWWIRYYRDGRRYEESSGSKKKGEAALLLKLREGDLARGVPVTPKVGRLKFTEAVADVERDYRVNGKRSADSVERRVRLHLEPYFGNRRMANLTAKDFRRYIARRQSEGAANATINRELAIVKRAFNLALEDGALMFAPKVPMLREDNTRTGFFERAEFDDVRDALPVPLQDVVTFAYVTGWRIPSEVLPLRWAQVDRKAGIVRLEAGTTKNDEGRTFPYAAMPEFADTIQRRWLEHNRLAATGVLCPYVFHRKGKPIKSFRKAWARACKAAGVTGKIPHDFRRTAVRNLVRAGVPEQTAMTLTGHKTRSVFDRYDIVNEADLRDAVGKLAVAAEGASAGSQRSGRVAPIDGQGDTSGHAR